MENCVGFVSVFGLRGDPFLPSLAERKRDDLRFVRFRPRFLDQNLDAP